MNNKFQQLFERAKKQPVYWVEKLKLDLTERIWESMQKKNITRSGLAEKMQVSPAYVTKMLRGNNNFTIETMVKTALALDGEIKINLIPKDADGEWVVLPKTFFDTEIETAPTNADYNIIFDKNPAEIFEGPIKQIESVKELEHVTA